MRKVAFLLLSLAVAAGAFDHSYSSYGALLNRYVCKGGVAYQGLGRDSQALRAAVQELSELSKKKYEQFSTKQKIAYLVNLYNFYTLKLIVDHYPTESIRDIKKPWSTEFVPLFDKRVSLDHIEHEVLRKEFTEPRIHVALVCASVGCPALSDEPFRTKTLDAQLDAAAKDFLTNPKKNRVEGKTVYLSKIFKWYGGDFSMLGGFKNYVAKVLGLGGDYRYKFMDYDWSLNEVDNCK